jgi:hypothetical protein
MSIIIDLKQSHFNKGTIILHNNYYIVYDINTNQTTKININNPNNNKLIYRLSENIEFNPNLYENDNITFKSILKQGVVEENQFISNGGFYSNSAFGIGFFAAICIIGKNFELDLNSFTISQSYQHSLRQRFFAVIEMASAPFIPNVGPHNFGPSIECAENIIIKNGKIGLSSHHGIHGNNNKFITIENVDFVDFEVAAISLNGSINTTLKNINVLGNNKNVKVLGIWSAGLFLLPYVYKLLENNNFINNYTIKIQNTNKTNFKKCLSKTIRK